MTKEIMLERAKTQIEALSTKNKQMWDELIRSHPWIKRDNSKLSNLTNR
ncbi:MAG: hypothetical protein ACKPE3_14400 [Sphaerospermopsis kisseleviana]